MQLERVGKISEIELYESDGKQIVFRIEEVGNAPVDIMLKEGESKTILLKGGRTKISVQIEGKILDKASISGQLNLA